MGCKYFVCKLNLYLHNRLYCCIFRSHSGFLFVNTIKDKLHNNLHYFTYTGLQRNIIESMSSMYLISPLSKIFFIPWTLSLLVS